MKLLPLRPYEGKIDSNFKGRVVARRELICSCCNCAVEIYAIVTDDGELGIAHADELQAAPKDH